MRAAQREVGVARAVPKQNLGSMRLWNLPSLLTQEGVARPAGVVQNVKRILNGAGSYFCSVDESFSGD